MTAVLFDGVLLAREIESNLSVRVRVFLDKKGRAPKLVSLYDPKNEASVKYTLMKQKKAEKVGIQMQGIEVGDEKTAREWILRLNSDDEVDGIMVQLPLADKGETELSELVSLIDRSKDVDGLTLDSGVTSATVKAVWRILERVDLENSKCKFGVVGNRGAVGRRIEKLLKEKGFAVKGWDKGDLVDGVLRGTDVVISATGKANLIDKHQLDDGVILIDVGSPDGDFARDVVDVASVVTPVPGGVGPVTVACLLENLLEICEGGI